MQKSQSSRIFLAAALLGGTWLMYLFTAPQERGATKPPVADVPAKGISQQAANPPTGGSASGAKEITAKSAPLPAEAAPTASPAAKLPELADLPANREQTLDVLDRLQLTLRDFRTANGENPVGTNAEITRALLGDNLKQTKHDIPQGTRLNASGELCDPWGTPYFFHQQSGSKMEIRSAGPDHKMWTDDDVQM